MARILTIEDDDDTANAIRSALTDHGHEVSAMTDGAKALERAVREPFDAITLDRMLPGLDGLSLVAELRRREVRTPVLMISALSDVDERIAGLRAGGDDYLVKPFAPEEMVMRVEVLLRRGREEGERSIAVGAIRIDLLARQVTVDGVAVRLLPTEFRLLEFLARHSGRVVGRQIIFEKVWGYYFDPGANLLNVHIGRLRRKLDRPGRPSAIATVKGEGYRLDAV